MAPIAPTPAYAEGGASSGTAVSGGADSVSAPGGNGGTDTSSPYRGGGGGGSGVVGGAGGVGYNNSSPAAAGGATAGASGASGAGDAGNGGGGGAHGFVGVLPTGASSGGNGGDGGASSGNGGGGGGAGGYGAVVTGDGTLTTAVTGGNGGNGGSGFIMGSGGSGGVGLLVQGSSALTVGTGVVVSGGSGGSTQDGVGIFGGAGNGGAGGKGIDVRSTGLVLTNNGSIVGGSGRVGGNGGPGVQNGPPGTGPRYSGTDGAGGAGITGAGLTIINSGSIAGGQGYVNRASTQANAITFTGGVNALTITASSTISGRVDAFSTNDTFGLGGSVNASFALSQLGAAGAAVPQYRGFGILEKSGTSTWTVTGTASTPLAYRVLNGTLDLGASNQSATSLLLTGGTLRNGTLTSSGVFDVRSGTISSNLAGTGSLTKTTNGTVSLSGTNTYSGTTTIGGGILEANSSAALGDGSTTNTLIFNGGTLRATGAITSLDDRGVQMLGAGTLDTNGNAVRFGGNITGAGALTKTGGGTLTLSGVGTSYYGAITVSSGAVNIQSSSALGSTAAGTTVTAGAALELQNDIAVGTEALTLAGLGVGGTGALRNVSGDNSYGGAITITGDTRINSDTGSLALSGDIDGDAAGRVLTIGGAGNGTISGIIGSNINGVTKDGLGVWALTGANTYAGATAITAGTLQVGDTAALGDGSATNSLIFSGGTLQAVGDITSPNTRDVILPGAAVIDTNGHAVSLAGTISGLGTLTKTGLGTLTLTGTSTYTGQTSVDAGRLSVDGAITASSIVVNNGGRLGGTGTIFDALINTGGTLAAGNSIGTLNVSGALTMGADSTLEVEIGSGGNMPGVHNDLVAVGGALTIDPLAKVLVKSVPTGETGTTYEPETTYTILTANRGRTGTFNSVADDFAFLDASLDYDADNVYLSMKRNDLSFSGAAATPNQRGVADALSGFSRTDPAVQALLNLSEQDAKAAFASASGDSQAAAQAVIGQTFDLLAGNLGSGSGGSGRGVLSMLDAGPGHTGIVEAEPSASSAAWLTPIAAHGVIDGDGNGAASDWSTGGLLGGVERQLSLGGGDAAFGIGAGFVATEVSSPARETTSTVQGGQVGAYGTWTDSALDLSAQLTYGANYVHSSRGITIGALKRTATASYWVQGAGIDIKAGYGLALTDSLKAGPIAAVGLGWSGHNGFSETGAGSLNGSFAANGSWRTDTALGVGASYQLDGDEGHFKVSGRALWLHKWGEVVAQQTLTLEGGGGAFTVSSPEIGRDRMEVGAGFQWQPTDQLTVSLDYTGRFFGGQSENIAKVGLSAEF
ncbi:autotransporter domain-containing protein [Devosia sp. UYZn731]|uniref:autotransporter domain-containing protein n=1 Tax=Devosia sp. UYZn731 TaxID=3156345 RepID=UPI0033980C7D